MKNKLWRFGDSWSQTLEDVYPDDINHSYWIAEHLGLECINCGFGGASIFDIIKQITNKIFEIKKGDYILLNIPDKSRVGFISTEGQYINSAIMAEDFEDTKNLVVNSVDINFPKKISSTSYNQYIDVINNDVTKYISSTLIEALNNLLVQIEKQGVNVITFWNHGDDTNPICGLREFPLNSLGAKRGFAEHPIELGFEDFSPKGNLHYLYGKQKDWANEIIKFI